MSGPVDPRILIVRLSAIGDVVHGLPVLNALRLAMPRAFISWIVEGRAADLLRGHEALDALVEVPRGWLKSPRTVLDLRRRLRALRIDVSLDLQGLSKSALAARLSGARRRIGPGGPDGREISRWLNNELVVPTATHIIDRNLQLAAPLVARPAKIEFRLPHSAADSDMAARAVAAAAGGRRLAIINPGAGWPSKLWPAERLAAVAAHLGRRHDLPTLVVWAGAAERQWAEEIVAGGGGFARLAPPTSLMQLAALARRAALFIGSDTGPLHLAAAVGTPCVGLYGPMPAERNGPYGDAHIAIQEVCLEGSSRARRTADNASMRAISVERVCAACDEILARRSTLCA